MPTFKDFIFGKFQEWEKQQPGQRSSYTAFAQWLSDNSWGVEFKQQLVSDWLRGKYKPSEDKYLLALEEKLGKDIYQVLGVKRPNPYLIMITMRWDRIPADKQKQLAEDAEKYVMNNAKTHNASSKRKTSPR